MDYEEVNYAALMELLHRRKKDNTVAQQLSKAAHQGQKLKTHAGDYWLEVIVDGNETCWFVPLGTTKQA